VLLLAALAAASVRGSRVPAPPAAGGQPEADSAFAPARPSAPPAPQPRAVRSARQARRRFGLAVALPLLVGQAALSAEAFSLQRLPSSRAGVAAPASLDGELFAAPSRPVVVRRTALDMARTRDDVRTLWPAQWRNVLTDPKLVVKGKYSEVYKCHSEPRFGSFDIAIKMLDVSTPQRAEAVAREIDNLKRLSGRSMIEVFSVMPSAMVDGRINNFLVMMEAADGNLRNQVLCDGCDVGLADRLQVMIDTLRGLRRMHREGYIHRNIKPENIFVMRTDRLADQGRLHAKVGDLGNARTNREIREEMWDGDKPQIFGTREYIAPEVWAGRRDSCKRDVWAAGIVLYELFVGRLPAFFREERFANPPASLDDDPLRLAVPKEFLIREDEGFLELREKEPQLAALLASMLQKNRWLRPSSEKALRILKEITTAKGITVFPPTLATLGTRAHVALMSDAFAD